MLSRIKQNAAGLIQKFGADMKRRKQDKAYKAYRKTTETARKNIQRDREMSEYGSETMSRRGKANMARHTSGKSIESMIMRDAAKKLKKSLK